MVAQKQASFFVHKECSVREVAAKVTETQEEDNSFFICDLFELKNTLELWRQQLPRVTPYFAIKSCTDRIVIRTLAMEGVNFDCSNKREIQAVLSAGVDSSRIIYANPAKQSSHLDFAESSGVTLMTFDCLEELQKIKDKNARLLLRFSAQAGDHEDRMARKYGCRFLEAEKILRAATDQGHTVVGIAFHIGGRHFSSESYRNAIEKARRLFDLATEMGINMTVLDIGGGFLGSTRRRDNFIQVCETVRSALDEHFPSSGGTHILAEPGQFMVTSSFTLAVKVVAKRTRQTSVDGELRPYHDVYINDSRENSIPRENYEALGIKYHPLSPPHERPYNQLTTLWGATCHPMDKFEDHVPFFEVSVGEWLLMDNVGAYGLVKDMWLQRNGLPAGSLQDVGRGRASRLQHHQGVAAPAGIHRTSSGPAWSPSRSYSRSASSCISTSSSSSSADSSPSPSGVGFVAGKNIPLLEEKPSYIDFVRAYRTNPDFQHLIDSVQESPRCCGFSTDSFRDWNCNEYSATRITRTCSAAACPPSYCRPANSSKKTAVVDNLMCARGVLLNNDASAWEVVYVRSCADATQAYLAAKYRVFATGTLLVTAVCLALIIVTRNVQDEITDLRLIYKKYYETVRHGQCAMRKAGVIKPVKPDDVTSATTTGGSRSVGSTGKVAN
ncbi:hypothetical protein MTO96_023468 [Rhipicephalus appendiculatus]